MYQFHLKKVELQCWVDQFMRTNYKEPTLNCHGQVTGWKVQGLQRYFWLPKFCELWLWLRDPCLAIPRWRRVAPFPASHLEIDVQLMIFSIVSIWLSGFSIALYSSSWQRLAFNELFDGRILHLEPKVSKCLDIVWTLSWLPQAAGLLARQPRLVGLLGYMRWPNMADFLGLCSFGNASIGRGNHRHCSNMPVQQSIDSIDHTNPTIPTPKDDQN